MNENNTHLSSPLSMLLEDDQLAILETIIPFCSPSMGKNLALHVKIEEIRKILVNFNDPPLLKACGFEESPRDLESILQTIRNSVSKEKASQIDSLIKAVRFSKLFDQYNELTKANISDTKEENSQDALMKMLESSMGGATDFRDISKLLNVLLQNQHKDSEQ